LNLLDRNDGEFAEIKTYKFSIKDPKEFKRISNNVYIKNFDPSWDKEKIEELFKKYGAIKSVSVMADP
jgi:RNA recognition motif-containing protein